MRWLPAIVLLIFISGRLLAQHAPGMLINSPPPRPARAVPHHFSRDSVFFGVPWFGDYGYAIQQPPPQVIVVQPQPAATPEPKKEEAKPITPLMIELQNGHYVRSDAKSPTSTAKAETSSSQPVLDKFVAPQVAKDPLPAVLVFRDGHREKVREYTVADGALYARGDYWADGYWNKRILLSALDLPATLAVNHESGIDFVLPSGPNVVVVGP